MTTEHDRYRIHEMAAHAWHRALQAGMVTEADERAFLAGFTLAVEHVGEEVKALWRINGELERLATRALAIGPATIIVTTEEMAGIRERVAGD